MKKLFIGIALFLLIALITVPASAIRFIDKTIEAGLSYPLSASFGFSWGDFNQDGWVDLYIRNHAQQPSLYQNIGNGIFEDITLQSGIVLSGDLHGASWGDFDNDGDMDLYQVLGSPGAGKMNYLYRNDDISGIFTDIAESGGVTDRNGRGRTAVWFDYDLDGYLDLFVGNLIGTNSYSVLFHNNGNETFTDVTATSGLTNIEASIAVAGDYDNDGDLDLFTNTGVYRNEGNGSFTDVTVSMGLNPLTKINDLALGDYDNDGDLDIYIDRGNGDGDAYISDADMLRYTLRISNNEEKGFEFSASSSVQFDIYHYGARIKTKNIFIGAGGVNPEAVPFTLDSSSPLTYGSPLYSPGIDSGVFIWYDLLSKKWYIRHSIGSARAGNGVIISSPGSIGGVNPVGLEIDNSPVPNRLFQNQGNGTFVDVTDQAGVGDLGQSQSVVWADFDNDSDMDLYVVNSGKILNEPNILYENLGDGTFVNVALESGTVALTEGRGESAAVADYDNDGFVDILVLNGFGLAPFSFGPRVLFHNEGTGNNWLQIKLTGHISNRNAVGAAVEINAGPLTILRQQTGGVHHASQNSQILQFGLGSEPLVDRITIHWPSGIVQQLSNIDINQRIVIEEPKVSITLTPNTSTVSQGGVLGFQATATNNTGEEQTFFFATNATLPDGTFYPPYPEAVYGPLQVVLAPHETINGFIAHEVPADAQTGDYLYNGYAGKGPWDIWNEDHFEFTITPAVKQGE